MNELDINDFLVDWETFCFIKPELAHSSICFSEKRDVPENIGIVACGIYTGCLQLIVKWDFFCRIIISQMFAKFIKTERTISVFETGLVFEETAFLMKSLLMWIRQCN